MDRVPPSEDAGVGIVVLVFAAMLSLLAVRCAPASPGHIEPVVVDAAIERAPLKLCNLDSCTELAVELEQLGFSTWSSVLCYDEHCGFSCRSFRAQAACDAIGGKCDRDGVCSLPEEEE